MRLNLNGFPANVKRLVNIAIQINGSASKVAEQCDVAPGTVKSWATDGRYPEIANIQALQSLQRNTLLHIAEKGSCSDDEREFMIASLEDLKEEIAEATQLYNDVVMRLIKRQ